MLADIAIMMADFVSIPIYPTLNADSIFQILIHSESKAIIIGKLDDFESQKSGIPEIHKISIGLYNQETGILWEDIISKQDALVNIKLPQKEKLHTIIYTSGTTGIPKGVMHSSGSFMESSRTLKTHFEFPDNLKLFSYLPLAHVAERVLVNAGLVFGGNVTFAESLETFAKELEATQPHLFFAVPRIWTKFREKILETIMTMLEAFADKRQILKPLHQWALREPKFGLTLAQLAYQICDRILLISGDFPQDTLIANIRRSVRVKGIIALLIKIRAVWLQDQSDDMAPTFRALDSSMQQACEWAESLRLFDNHSEEKKQT